MVIDKRFSSSAGLRALPVSGLLFAAAWLALGPAPALAAEDAAPVDPAPQHAGNLPEPDDDTDPQGAEPVTALPTAPGAPPRSVAPAAAAPAPTPPKDIAARFIWSQFLDAAVVGDAEDTLRYGGKIDAYFDMDDSAIGLDEGLRLHVHPEFRYGQSSNGEIGLLPVNTALFYPGDGEDFDLSINLRKRWSSGTSLTVGKVNVLDLAARAPIIGGGGHEGFQNLAFALPPSAIVPASITGAMLDIPIKDVLLRFWVYDPDLQSQRNGFEDPFHQGVGFLASATFPVKIGGQQGYYAVKLSASTRDGLAADALPAVLVPAPGSGFGEKKGEFSVVLAGYQNIAVHEGGGSIGVFAQAYVSNGDPTFFDVSAIAGISGNPAGRPKDRFGIGWFRYSLTDGLVDALASRLALEDEEGVEIFYTAQIAERFRLTGNVQIVDSTVVARDVGVTTGLRLTTRF